MPSQYAKDTGVPVERSRSEIERVLTKYGCDTFAFGWTPVSAMIQFGYKGRQVKLDVKVPTDKTSKRQQQIARQRWRVLLLLIKAQLEAVETGIMDFEESFLPWMLLEGGETVAQRMIPQLPPPAKEPLKLREAQHG